MKEWIQGYQIKGKVKEAVEGTKSLFLLTPGETRVTQRSYWWAGGTKVEIEETAMGMAFEEETVTFPNVEEAREYVIEKAEILRGLWDSFSLRVDIPEQVKVDRARALEKEGQE